MKNIYKGSVIFLLLLCMGVYASAQTTCVNYRTAVPLYTGTWNPLWNFPNSTHPAFRQVKVPGLNFASYFRGLLEYKPSDYSPTNTAIKHPLIIFFHGGASAGDGSFLQLCRLFKDNQRDDLVTFKSLPGRVERSNEQFTQLSRKYIVVSPQFNQYLRKYPEPVGGNRYPSAVQVEQVINYVLSRYPNKIDTRKIYLTGYSTGANMIMEYVGSSEARARRIAAVMPVSLCSQLYHYSNKNMGVNAANIGKAKLKVWFVQCEIDYPCGSLVPREWYNAIKSTAGAVMPRFTMLANRNPATLYNCSDTLLHDAWSRAYDPNFKASLVNGNGVNDGINQNVYQWFMAQSNVLAPLMLASSSVQLRDDKVEVLWSTEDERDNDFFTIERAGPDQQFKPIGDVPGAGTYSGNKKYTFFDDAPLTGLSFYRLVQTNADGEKNYLEARRVLNERQGKSLLVATPNPFTTKISAFVNVERPQRVSVTITDMTGRVLRRVAGNHVQRSTMIDINSVDLPRGMYLLRVDGEDFQTTQKIMKK